MTYKLRRSLDEEGGAKKTRQLKLLTDVWLSNGTAGCFSPNKQTNKQGKSPRELARADNEDSPVNSRRDTSMNLIRDRHRGGNRPVLLISIAN